MAAPNKILRFFKVPLRLQSAYGSLPHGDHQVFGIADAENRDQIAMVQKLNGLPVQHRAIGKNLERSYSLQHPAYPGVKGVSPASQKATPICRLIKDMFWLPGIHILFPRTTPQHASLA